MSEKNEICENREKTRECGQKDGGVSLKGPAGAIHCMSIIGQIEGHYISQENQKATKYEHIIPLLAAIEESEETEGLLVMLNTMGGDVEAGLAISEMIASMSKPTVSVVLGGGHSIGVPLAVAAKRSFIVPSATMTVHPVRFNGLVIGVPQSFEYMREVQNRICDFICRNSKVERSTLDRLMSNTASMANDVGTIIGGNEAVACGLIDSVGGLSDALQALRQMIRQKGEVSGSEE